MVLEYLCYCCMGKCNWKVCLCTCLSHLWYDMVCFT